MAIKGDQHKSFGIRRALLPHEALPIIERFREMDEDGLLLNDIKRRESLHTTILPRRRLDRQLRRGIILGYEFSKTIAATKQEIQENAESRLVVQLGEIAVLKNRIIVHKIESEALQEEVDATCALLGRFGLKGLMREKTPLHITLGESDNLISQNNQRYIERSLDEVMPVGEFVTLDDLELYPAKYAQGA
jgi:hypothetical protein